MKRRCALVRGLAFEADIYLLDEPFRALDEDNAEKVRNIIKQMADNKLFIIVTHNEEDYKLLNAKKVLL
jgi:ABC-type multidrug transport system ATPase subunit